MGIETVVLASAVASSAMGIAGTVMQAQQQRAVAEQQARQQELNNQAALKQMQENYEALNVQDQESRKQSIDAEMQNQKDASQAQARVNLMSAASGMQGQSIDDLFFQIEKKKGENLNDILMNRENQIYNITRQAEQVQATAEASRSNRAFYKPSGWETGLRAVKSGMGGAMEGYKFGHLAADYFGLKGGN